MDIVEVAQEQVSEGEAAMSEVSEEEVVVEEETAPESVEEVDEEAEQPLANEIIRWDLLGENVEKATYGLELVCSDPKRRAFVL